MPPPRHATCILDGGEKFSEEAPELLENVNDTHTHRLVMSLGWSCFRSKRLKYAIKQWKDRVHTAKTIVWVAKLLEVPFRR